MFSKKSRDSYTDFLQLSAGSINPREIMLRDVSQVTSQLFFNSLPKSPISTQDFEKLTEMQKFILRTHLGIEGSPAYQISVTPYEMRTNVAKICKDLFETIIAESFDKKENYVSKDESGMKSMELHRQLIYFCFLCSIAAEDSTDKIQNLIPFDRSVYSVTHVFSGIESKVIYFHGYGDIASQDPLNPSYYVFLDHIGQNVIVCIRDLENLQKAVTFTLEKDEKVEEKMIEIGSKKYAGHKLYDIASSNILESLYKKLGEWCPQYPHYTVKIIGHGYGAGVAAMLVWKLNTKNDNNTEENRIISSTIRGIFFSCPPIFDEELCKLTVDLCVNVVTAWDVFSCMSFANIYKFIVGRDEYKKLLDKEKDGHNLLETKFIPGTIYWLTTKLNGSVDDIHIIKRTSERFHTLRFHDNMEEDYRIQKTYAYLLASMKNINDSLK